MRAYNVPALVLRTYRYGEADRIVVFLTEDRGKRRGVAKNATNSRRRFGAALEPLTRGRVAYVEKDGRELVRVDRIERVTLLDQRYELPEGFTVDQVLDDHRAFIGEPAARVRIRYAAMIARWIAERAGKELDNKGCLVMDHPLGDPEWAVRHVLQYGPDAEVLEPVEVRDRLREVLQGLASDNP